MKVLLLITLIFCFTSFAYNIPECHRCLDMVDTINLYCKKFGDECNKEKFVNFITETCDRFLSVDKVTCASDSELALRIFDSYSTGLTANSVCMKASICPAKVLNNDIIRNPMYRSFSEFKAKFQKKYSSVTEESKRARIFFNNMRRIDTLNRYARDNHHSTKFGITEFADLSHYEFKLTRLSKFVPVKDNSVPVVTQVNSGDIPASFDWRTKGAVTPVKNQGQCGSCWSFSTTGNVEGQWFLSGHKLVGLSEQNLVDCDHECMNYQNQQTCDAGCDGGLMMNAFAYILKNGGIDTEASYPYQAVDGTCAFNKTNVGATITNFTMISQNETIMAEYLVANGPVSIAADATEWQFYIGGVFDLPCGKTLDHGILIVGYGVEVDILGFHKPFWWVKNSWGASWGESGYLKIKRGDCKCGLCEFACSSIITK